MDFWNITEKQVIEMAEKHYNKKVKKLYGITSGLWRTVLFMDDTIENVYAWMNEN